MYRLFLFLLSLVLIPSSALAATTLNPGDIAFITVNAETGFNAGDTCASDNSFEFVTLVDIEAGTVIYFADEGWNNGVWRTGLEGVVKYTVAADLTKGDIVRYEDCKLTTEPAVWERDGIPFGSGGTFDPSTSGDNLLAFQGTDAAPSFISGIGWARGASWINAGSPSTNDSYIPAALSAGANTIIDLGTRDNYQYSCALLDLDDTAAFLASTANPANWNGDNATIYGASTCAFTFTPPAPPAFPTTPVINSSPGKKGNTLRYSGQTRGEYNALQFDGTDKKTFADAYAKSLASIGTWGLGAPSKVLTYINQAGEERFAGYRPGRIAVTRFFAQPYRVAWRGLPQYRSGETVVRETEFKASATDPNFLEKKQNQVEKFIATTDRKLQQNHSYEKNRTSFKSFGRVSRKTDTETIITSRDFVRARQILPVGFGERSPSESWKASAPGWVPHNPNTNRAPMKKLYQITEVQYAPEPGPDQVSRHKRFSQALSKAF